MFQIEVKVRKLTIAAAALAAATFLPASAFALTGAMHSGAAASSSVVKVADIYRPVRHYPRYHGGGCCVTPVYANCCGCGGCGGWGGGWGAGWGGGCGCGSGWGWGGGGFWPFW
jgi:hypothetical protein